MSKTENGDDILNIKVKTVEENKEETKKETKKETKEETKKETKEETKEEGCGKENAENGCGGNLVEAVTRTRWETRQINSVDTVVKIVTVVKGGMTTVTTFVEDKTKKPKCKYSCELHWKKIKETENGKVVYGEETVDLGTKCSYCEERDSQVQNTTNMAGQEHVIVTEKLKKNGSELCTIIEDGKIKDETLNGESTARDCGCGDSDKLIEEANKLISTYKLPKPEYPDLKIPEGTSYGSKSSTEASTDASTDEDCSKCDDCTPDDVTQSASINQDGGDNQKANINQNTDMKKCPAFCKNCNGSGSSTEISTEAGVSTEASTEANSEDPTDEPTDAPDTATPDTQTEDTPSGGGTDNESCMQQCTTQCSSGGSFFQQSSDGGTNTMMMQSEDGSQKSGMSQSNSGDGNQEAGISQNNSGGGNQEAGISQSNGGFDEFDEDYEERRRRRRF